MTQCISLQKTDKKEIAESIYDAIVTYKKEWIEIRKKKKKKKPKELPLKNDFRVLLMSTPTKYSEERPCSERIKIHLNSKGKWTL